MKYPESSHCVRGAPTIGYRPPKPFASWAQDIDCLDRRQCFPAYEPLYSFAPSNDLLDPNHTCPVPQTLMYRTPQTLFSLAPTLAFLDPYHWLPWTPTIGCPATLGSSAAMTDVRDPNWFTSPSCFDVLPSNHWFPAYQPSIF